MMGELTQEPLCFDDGACSFIRKSQSRYLLVMDSKSRIAGSPSPPIQRVVQRCGHWETPYSPILISTCDYDCVPSTWPSPTPWFPALVKARATIAGFDNGRLARDLHHRKASPQKTISSACLPINYETHANSMFCCANADAANFVSSQIRK